MKATEPITIKPYTKSKKRSSEQISTEDEEMGGTLPAAPITINASTTARKRSREETSPEDEEMGMTLPPSRTPGISPTAIAGEGMTSINPLTGTATTAETQSGTWFEDQLEKKLQSDLEDAAVQTGSDGEFPKRKVQRRDASNTDVGRAANPSEAIESPTVADPIIDQYTRQLGIGWRHVGEDSGWVAMARAFSRYIDNHYPHITSPEVLLKSKSLDSYLVEASEGFFLFSENLQQGRLVARTWADTLANLQSKPIQFLEEQPVYAAGTPDKERESDNGTAASPKVVQGGDMEMEMD